MKEIGPRSHQKFQKSLSKRKAVKKTTPEEQEENATQANGLNLLQAPSARAQTRYNLKLYTVLIDPLHAPKPGTI
jgi:hypothetical protein